MSKGKGSKKGVVKKQGKSGMFIGTDGVRFVPDILGYAPAGELQIMIMTAQGERVLNYRTTEYRDKVIEFFDKGYKAIDLREPEEDEEVEGQLL